MNYIKYFFETKDEVTQQILVAFLADLPFDTFMEGEEGLEAYLPQVADNELVTQVIENLKLDYEFQVSKTEIPYQNWNEEWEKNFTPVIVEDFCGVRADFHEPFGDAVQYELRIHPRMAFGTGHHETTWMCLKMMQSLPLKGKKIFDYGCGTGILAILAAKMGAAEIEAIDIEEESYLNTVQNAGENKVTNIKAKKGVLGDVSGSAFDGILANINRNVLLDSAEKLRFLIKPGGWLLLSGFHEVDFEKIEEAFMENGFMFKKNYSAVIGFAAFFNEQFLEGDVCETFKVS